MTCRNCAEPAEEGRVRCRRHLDLARAATRRWSERNPDRARKIARSAYERNRDRINQARVLGRYGLTPEQYDQMLEEQGGVCLLCRRPETVRGNNGRVKRLAVDHCHTTGKVRGLLCNNRNRAIGLLGDDPAVISRAAEYLVAGLVS